MAEKILINDDQKKAIQHESGPLLVVAGAGTGKTRVITERIKYLVEKRKVAPSELLALTFTEKASEEMLSRIDTALPLGYEEPWVYTFHSFADRLLREEGLEIGLDTSYEILSYPQQWLLFRQNLFEFNLDYYRPLGNPTKFISAILKFISRLQDENISPEELKGFVENTTLEDMDRWQELADTYERYTELKIKNSKMDFGDLIVWAIQLFKTRPAISKKYQTQFKHVLVDEFQDTNYAQYELIKLLCPQDMGDRSLVVVGDDSQSIYKFRGAAVSNILEFQKDYPDFAMVTLLKNYRSGQKILDASYKVVKNNNPDSLESKLGISKQLESQVIDADVPPKIIKLADAEAEVEFVVLTLLNILAKEPGFTYKDIAILARANNHLDPFILALRKYGVPYQLVGNRGLYDRDEVRDVLALLKVLVNPQDAISLYRALSIDCLGVPAESVGHLLAMARVQKESLWAVTKASRDEKIQEFCQLIGKFSEKIAKATPVEIVYELVNSINYLDQFLKTDTIENELSVRNMDLFLNGIKQFEVKFRKDTNELPTLVELLDYLELMLEAGDNPAQAEIEDVDTVKLLTVHASKGLEFPVVFMVDLISSRFPTRNRSDPIEIPEELIKEALPSGDAHIQEERRLFYVGLTRAKKYLYLTFANNYGGFRDSTPSGFLTETGLKIEEVNIDDVRKGTSQQGLFGVSTKFRETTVQKTDNFFPSFLSYTQISMYKGCPLQYKYAYILNIPTPPNHALSFGITIHETLKDFHSRLMFEDVSLEALYEIYAKNWQPLGYLNEEHRQHRFESGKEMLRNYFNSVDKSQKSLGLEKSFNIRIGGSKFYGRIDRIVPFEDGVEIIDYKTGSAKSQKDVDNDDQMDFYAIGVLEALKYKPKKLTFYFLEENQKVSTVRTPDKLEDTKEEVASILEDIKLGKFEANPGWQCSWCDYKGICPFAWEG